MATGPLIYHVLLNRSSSNAFLMEWYSVFMNRVAVTIDVVYQEIITFTVRLVLWFLRTYTGNQSISHYERFEAIPGDVPSTNESPDDKALETPQIEESFKSVGEILGAEAHTAPLVEKNTVMYANTVRVPVFKNPTVEWDGVIGEIPYGEMVIVLEPRGRFYRVMWQTTEGWVFRDDIADRAMRVHPAFVVGEENSVDAINTIHVRAILGDVFGMGRSEFPLQAGEYVLYKLWKKGLRILWPSIRPRTPGLWHKILRGVEKVHIGVTPKMGALMEYTTDVDMGHLAYVEAIFPDNTITVSEANFPDSGIYNERELREGEWKELKPVFITVT
jgi:hypothetical protein